MSVGSYCSLFENELLALQIQFVAAKVVTIRDISTENKSSSSQIIPLAVLRYQVEELYELSKR